VIEVARQRHGCWLKIIILIWKITWKKIPSKLAQDESFQTCVSGSWFKFVPHLVVRKTTLTKAYNILVHNFTCALHIGGEVGVVNSVRMSLFSTLKLSIRTS
jgi:hypothetical protein